MTTLNWPGNDEVKGFSNTVGSLIQDLVIVVVSTFLWVFASTYELLILTETYVKA